MSFRLISLVSSFVTLPVGLYVAARDRNKDKLNKRMAKELSDWRRFCEQLAPDRFDNVASSDDVSAVSRKSTSTMPVPVASASLEIQNKNGEIILSVSDIADPNTTRWEHAQEIGNNWISKLTPLLSGLPVAAIGGNVATTRYMVVQCAGTLTKAMDGEGFRAIVRDGKKIVDQARLFPPEHLGRIVTAGALWQIASIVVAQKHLHDINEKLQAIGRRIDEIRIDQQNYRTSKILACQKYFNQICEDIERGNTLSTEQKTTIESQCVKMLEIQTQSFLEIVGIEEKLVKIAFGEEFDDILPRWATVVNELFVCIETSSLGYQLMAIGIEDASLVQRRLDDVQREIDRLKRHFRLFANHIASTLTNDASFWGNLGKIERSINLLEKLQIPSEFEKSFDQGYQEVGMARNIIEQRRARQEILLKVSGGQIEGWSVVNS